MERLAKPEGRPVVLQSFAQRFWPGISAESGYIPKQLSYEFLCQPSAPQLILLDILRADGETFGPGFSRSVVKDLRDKLCFTPPNCAMSGWSRVEKSGSYVSVLLDSSEGGKSEPDLHSLPPQMLFEDGMLRAILTHLRCILLDPTLDLTGYAETLGILLRFEILRLSRQRQAESYYSGGLTPRQFQHVVNYMEDNLQRKISIAQIAASAGISRFHFIRAFKKTAGTPPHQYLLSRRIEHARFLLSDSPFSVAEIAEMSGFSGIAQLTRAFRKIVGVSPSAFRKDKRF